MDRKEISISLKVKLVLAASAFLLFIFVLLFTSRNDGKLHLVFCDAGQGDAIYIKTPRGDDVLIDGGPDDKVLTCLSSEMKFFDKTIEFLVLTHPQKDHLGGLIEVLRRYKVERVLRTDQENKTKEFEAWREELKKENTSEVKAKSGQSIDFGGGLAARVIWPQEGIIETDLNDTSIVLRFDYGQFCAFLTGDATNDVWTRISVSQPLSKCHVLKVAHHGSKNATEEFFLSQIQPEIAIISSGINNRFGHPHNEVLALLKKRKTKILRTDRDGKIEIASDGGEIAIKTDKM